MVRLSAGRATCDIDPVNGGRITSLVVDHHELLFTDSAEPLLRGCYPMAPYAGRVRDAVVHVDGRSHPLRRNADPHSIHGTVFDRAWRVTHQDRTSVAITIDLGPLWPFRGSVTQRISLHPDHIRLELELHAVDRMPAQVGWHPCFVKPTSTDLRFRHMLERDRHGIATATRVKRDPVDVDDCFEGVATADGLLRLTVAGVGITLASDCSHWVVYDRPTHTTCVEPQSGPPDGVNFCPEFVNAGGSIHRFLTIGWR